MREVYDGHPFTDHQVIFRSKRKKYQVVALDDLELWQGVRYKVGDRFVICGLESGGYLRQISGHGHPIEAFKIGRDVALLDNGDGDE